MSHLTRLRYLLPLLLVTACTPYVQTTSGADYISRQDAGGRLSIDKDIAKVAAVEPNLRFPARIGVARVVNGHLSDVPSAEAELFAEFVQRNGRYGEFVPVSPLISSMVNGDLASRANQSQKVTVINQIRRTSARQHLDYVLIYEIGARTRRTDTPFALADVTLIGGAFLPTRNVKVAGIGQAMLIDVRNGYPYGTAAVTKDISGLARSFGTRRREAELRDRATLKVAQSLIPDVEQMLTKLYQRR